MEWIGAARPDLPLVPMGYANQVISGGDGEAVARRLAGAVARPAGSGPWWQPTLDGAPFEAVARAVGLAVVYLVAPTTPPARRTAVAARSGGFLYCVSLVGVTLSLDARCLRPSGGWSGTSRRSRRSLWPSVSASASRPTSGRSARAGADGVIVASALVDALGA